MPRDMDEEDHMNHAAFAVWAAFRIVLSIIVFVILVGIIVSVVYTPTHPMFFFPWVWGLIGIFFLLWFLSWIFRPWHHRHRYWGEVDETRILRRRYARGEITREQFKSMMKDLRESEK